VVTSSLAVLLGGCLAGALLATLPYWLPRLVIRLRLRIFAAVNGDEGIAIPGPLVPVARFREVYSHPAARGRSKGAGLSDLFWYWLAPGPEVHQEHLESGDRYTDVARATRQILARPRRDVEDLAARCAGRVLDELAAAAGTGKLIRLREVMMPIWAEFSYELVFGQPCPDLARELIVGNADDVVTARKNCGPRLMCRRDALTAHLADRVDAGLPHRLPDSLSRADQVRYLQGTFFNTAVVQMSEAMTHLLLAIAQHPDVQRRLVADPDDDRYLDRVIDETFRRYPLFGIAHRITTADIAVGDATLPTGSVLLFNYPEFHAAGFDDPQRFDPDRWEHLSPRDANHIPFGVTANRPCPAKGIAPAIMRVVARHVLARFALYSSAAHTRSVPNRGPCLVVPRDRVAGHGRRRRIVTLALLRVRDRWEDLWRSVLQLAFGTFMVWDARRKRLATRYFEVHDTQGRPLSQCRHHATATNEEMPT